MFCESVNGKCQFIQKNQEIFTRTHTHKKLVKNECLITERVAS